VGQPAITGTEKSQNGLIIRQGFQQSYSLPGVGIQDLNISLYPNPNNGEFLFRTDLKSDEQFLEENKEVAKLLKQGYAVRKVMKLADKSSGTVQKVKKLIM
jgi:hypothetical protein